MILEICEHNSSTDTYFFNGKTDSIEPKDPNLLNVIDFCLLLKNMGENISQNITKNVSGKCS